MGMPICTTSITVRTAASTVGKVATAAAVASGTPWRRRVSSVMIPSVPSLPMNSRVRS